jgi:hypothetical protein
MGKPGRPRLELLLTEGEREELVRLGKRARIVLACAESTDSAVASGLRTTNKTVGKWRRRFVEDRLDGLYDEPRVGAPARLTPEYVGARRRACVTPLGTAESFPLGGCFAHSPPPLARRARGVRSWPRGQEQPAVPTCFAQQADGQRATGRAAPSSPPRHGGALTCCIQGSGRALGLPPSADQGHRWTSAPASFGGLRRTCECAPATRAGT